MSSDPPSNASVSAAVPEIVLTRLFAAGRARVFKAWTDPQRLAQWWAPGSLSNDVREWDLRPGGALLIITTLQNGAVFPTKGVFREIAEPERLILATTPYEDKKGNPLLEIVHSVSLAEDKAQTVMTLHVRVTKSARKIGPTALAAMEANWNAALDRLAQEVAKM